MERSYSGKEFFYDNTFEDYKIEKSVSPSLLSQYDGHNFIDDKIGRIYIECFKCGGEFETYIVYETGDIHHTTCNVCTDIALKDRYLW